jgi:hypothetical protein
MNKPHQSRKIPKVEPKTLTGGRHPAHIPHLARTSEPRTRTRTSKSHTETQPRIQSKKQGEEALYLGRAGRERGETAAAIGRGEGPSKPAKRSPGI